MKSLSGIRSACTKKYNVQLRKDGGEETCMHILLFIGMQITRPVRDLIIQWIFGLIEDKQHFLRTTSYFKPINMGSDVKDQQ